MNAKTLFDKNDSCLCYAAAALLYVFASSTLGAVQLGLDTGSFGWWLMLALTSVVVGLTVVVYCFVTNKNIVCCTTLDVAPNVLHVVLGSVCVVGLVFCMTPVTNLIFDLIQSMGLARPEVNLPKDNIVPLLLVATFLPAFTEEIVFRGVVANGLLRSCKSHVVGIVLSAALFSLFHCNPAQTLHQFLVGCLLATLLLRSGSVWVCFVVHFVNNLVVVVGEFVLPPQVATDWTACIVGGVVAVASFVAYLVFVKPTDSAKRNFVPTVARTRASSLLAIGTAVVFFVVLWVANLLQKPV